MRDEEIRIQTTALEHARAMKLYDFELRVKNFNFFLIITGALLAAYLAHRESVVLFAAAGLATSLVFLILDIRVKQFLETTSFALESAERALRISTSPIRREPTWRERHVFGKVVSHTFAYRLLFVLTGTVSSWTLLEHL